MADKKNKYPSGLTHEELKRKIKRANSYEDKEQGDALLQHLRKMLEKEISRRKGEK